MATPLAQSIPRLDTPLVDPKSGIVTRPWYMLFVTLFNRTGGGAPPTSGGSTGGGGGTVVAGDPLIDELYGDVQDSSKVPVTFDLTSDIESRLLDELRPVLVTDADGSRDDIPAPSQAITIGASPFAFEATHKGQMYVTGGTVTDLSLSRRGTATDLGTTLGFVPMSRHDLLTVTYTGAPTMTFFPDQL